jgi:hypothetical protein
MRMGYIGILALVASCCACGDSPKPQPIVASDAGEDGQPAVDGGEDASNIAEGDGDDIAYECHGTVWNSPTEQQRHMTCYGVDAGQKYFCTCDEAQCEVVSASSVAIPAGTCHTTVDYTARCDDALESACGLELTAGRHGYCTNHRGYCWEPDSNGLRPCQCNGSEEVVLLEGEDCQETVDRACPYVGQSDAGG